MKNTNHFTSPLSIGSEADVYKSHEAEIECGPVALNLWLAKIGVEPITGWRWEKKGLIRTINICGRKYITQAAIKEFNTRAERGDFAKELKVPRKPEPNL